MAAQRPNVGAPAKPLRWPLNRFFLRTIFLAGFVLVGLLWWTNGSGDEALGSPATALIATGELSALFGTYVALAGFVLVSRAPFIEPLLGDQAVGLHKRLGIATILLLIGHVVGTVGGYTLLARTSLAEELTEILLTYPWMLAAGVALLLFVAIGVSSIPFIRRRLSYETWSGIHLYAYLAMVLGLGHQLAVGNDFVEHPIAQAAWVGMYVAVFALVVLYRVLCPIVLFARHRFRIEEVVVESSDIVSLYVTGRRLDRLPVRAGQYFRLRLLAKDEWWRCHPFSISAEPDGRMLRFTVKSLGDFSDRLQARKPGNHVMLEGPFGALTTAEMTRKRVALIGGGIGVTPLRAIFEELAGKVDVKLIYRASSPKDTVFSEELSELSLQPGAEVAYLVGKRGNPNMPEDPLSAAMIESIVPDIAKRDVFICGPVAMMDALDRTLRQLGVPRSQIHAERFAA